MGPERKILSTLLYSPHKKNLSRTTLLTAGTVGGLLPCGG